MKIRVGFGFDVHKLVEGRDLWMGGIKIEHSLGLLGHSDADVLIHAICDALLGAANMRDIGYHFPDTSADTLDIDSKILLKKTVDLIATKGYTVGNIDAVGADCLAPFDYAALGHIHKRMTVGNEAFRYCGTPLKYSVCPNETSL